MADIKSQSTAAVQDAAANGRSRIRRSILAIGMSLCFAQVFEHVSTYRVSKFLVKETAKGNVVHRKDYAFTEEEMQIIEDETKRSCYVIENICKSSDERTWFYHDPEGVAGNSTTNHQPNFFFDASTGKLKIPYDIRVNNSSPYSSENETCAFSPTPNHMIVTCAYTKFIAEFYPRVITGLWDLWNDLSTPWWKSSPRTEHIQIYVHSQLIPSMHPMINAYSSNPLLTVRDLFNNTKSSTSRCECYQRLVFCGYSDAKREAQKELEKKKDKLPNETIPEHLLAATTKLKAAGQIIDHDRLQSKKFPWEEVLVHTRDGALQSYADIETKIVEYRRNAVISSLTLASNVSKHETTYESTKNLDEWTIIGFSQREGRRRWLNLNETLQQCKDNWLPYRIACVVVNLDSEYGRDPENQVIMHASLNALIGIHGSQNVHGIWLPDGSAMLEILPYLGPRGFGDWGTHTKHPTINGMFFKKSKFLHVGYPLDASSVPNCEQSFSHISGCSSIPNWEVRDFLVPPNVIDSFVHKFIIPSNNDESTPQQQKSLRKKVENTTSSLRPCEEYAALANDEFVLYNVHCKPPLEYYKSFYRDRSSFTHLQQTPDSAPQYDWVLKREAKRLEKGMY